MDRKITVFGSFVTDLTSRSNAFPRPGETVKGNSFKMGPGGKGSNQAVAAHRAGADVTFVTKLGADALGQAAKDFYQSEGMRTDYVFTDPEAATGAALIMVNEESSENEIIVVNGACGQITPEETEQVLPLLDKDSIFLTQLETNLEPVYVLLKAAKKEGCVTILNPAPACEVRAELFESVDILTPNETEAEFFTGIRVTDEKTAAEAAEKLHAMGVANVVITLGAAGCYISTGKEKGMISAVNAGKVIDTTGAGDCFSGSFAAALAEGKEFADAVRFAAAASGISVTRLGTAPAMPVREEIEALLKQQG